LSPFLIKENVSESSFIVILKSKTQVQTITKLNIDLLTQNLRGFVPNKDKAATQLILRAYVVRLWSVVAVVMSMPSELNTVSCVLQACRVEDLVSLQVLTLPISMPSLTHRYKRTSYLCQNLARVPWNLVIFFHTKLFVIIDT
jgi:hypothetical protein